MSDVLSVLYRYPDALLLVTGLALFFLGRLLRRWGLNSVREQST